MICKICPRQCGVDRSIRTGFCRGRAQASVAHIQKHFGEEPCISGTLGSGTVFFGGCALQCVFCQNAEISSQNTSKDLSVGELRDLFLRIANSGVHNLNLVNPTHFTMQILEALDGIKLPVPIVWNSSGYETVETLRLLEGTVDIYLPDFKYISAELAKTYSNAEDYFTYASKAILEMCRQQPESVLEDGIMQKGVIIRHLILPSYPRHSMKVLTWLKENVPSSAYISLMGQYIPMGRASEYPAINRRCKYKELHDVYQHFEMLNFTNGFEQAMESANDDYIPHFDQSTVL